MGRKASSPQTGVLACVKRKKEDQIRSSAFAKSKNMDDRIGNLRQIDILKNKEVSEVLACASVA
jgi:hypothetical protein